MAARVYIDGFNLYHGAIKGSPFKWLDLHALACALLRDRNVVAVKYFTARVEDRPKDPRQSQRQDVYLRALATLPTVELHFGQFRTRNKRVRLARPDRDGPDTVLASVTEEKGTDVALGAHLVWDACRRTDNPFDTALVISNDSDLQVPVDMAMQLGVAVVTVNPHRHAGQAHHLFGSERRRLRTSHLAKSQFPLRLLDRQGHVITCPPEWGA